MCDHLIAEAEKHVSLLLDLNLKQKEILNSILERVEEHGQTIKERNLPRIDELEKMARTQLIWRIEDYNEYVNS